MDHSTIEQLASKYYDRLFRAALFYCNDPESAEDLVQDTFVAAATAIDDFEGRSSYYTWLYGIFLNKFRTWLRKKRKDPDISLQKQSEQRNKANIGDLLESDMPESSEILQKKERAHAVREVINELPPHHRDVIVLRYIEGMSYEKISGILDCSIGTVKSRIHYALEKVARNLKHHPSIENNE